MAKQKQVVKMEGTEILLPKFGVNETILFDDEVYNVKSLQYVRELEQFLYTISTEEIGGVKCNVLEQHMLKYYEEN